LPFSDGNVIRAGDVFRAKSFRKANEKDSMKEKIRYAVVEEPELVGASAPRSG